ncbi:MAG: nitroreductase [Endomicrobiia bacterium]
MKKFPNIQLILIIFVLILLLCVFSKKFLVSYSSDIKDVHTVIRTRRSIRKFKQKEIDINLLIQIVKDGGLAPSGGNIQPWEFIIVNERHKRKFIFENIYWLSQAGKPEENQQPVAYIVVLGNPKMSKNYMYDCAAACQNMLLSAWGYGIGSCWIGSMNKENIYKILKIPKVLEIVAIIALGYPDEVPCFKYVKKDNKNYLPYREKNVLFVPKYQIDNILHLNEYRLIK